MAITNTSLLSAYASIAQQTYLETGSTLPVTGPNGTYVEITQVVDGPLGFQARAFFNSSNNELVIAFTGTEGFSDVNAPEVVPDLVADLGLAVAGVSPQDAAAQAFIQQATLAAQAEVGLFGSFDVTYVGHSLGGFLAQTASASGPEGEVVVFNSPGAGGFLGLPENHPFSEDNFTYVYSDPSEWGLLGGAIHSVGTPLSDNIFYIAGSEGHALNTSDGMGLGDLLTDSSTLVSAGDGIFLPIDEALQILGATSLLDFFDDGSGDDPVSVIEGNDNNNHIIGTTEGDLIQGLGGNDTLNGFIGNDTIYGGDGNDRILGGTEQDELHGGNGNDTIDGGGGFDLINGDAGDDLLIGGNQADNLWGGTDNDVLQGSGGLDRLFGGTGDDTLEGGEGNDALFGNEGRDVVMGGSGNDRMSGNAGFDTIHGGDGNDTLSGGFNWDVFVFADNFGNDVVTDFDVANNFERIDLSGVGSINSFADLTSNHLSQSGTDAIIDAGGGNTITLSGVNMGDLTANDFIF